MQFQTIAYSMVFKNNCLLINNNHKNQDLNTVKTLNMLMFNEVICLSKAIYVGFNPITLEYNFI